MADQRVRLYEQLEIGRSVKSNTFEMIHTQGQNMSRATDIIKTEANLTKEKTHADKSMEKK